MSDDLIRRAPECIFCHPTEKQPTSAKNKSQAKWLRGKWKDHDSAASGDVEYIRADLVPAMAARLEAQEALLREVWGALDAAAEALDWALAEISEYANIMSRDPGAVVGIAATAADEARATLAKLRAHLEDRT